MANAVIVSAIDLAVSFIGLLLTIVGLAGVSEDSDTIKNVAWAKWSDEGYMDLGFLGEGELKISFYAATRRVGRPKCKWHLRGLAAYLDYCLSF